MFGHKNFPAIVKVETNARFSAILFFAKTTTVTVAMHYTALTFGRPSFINCPSSKGNHAPNPKFERPNEKNAKSQFFFNSVKNWSVQLT